MNNHRTKRNKITGKKKTKRSVQEILASEEKKQTRIIRSQFTKKESDLASIKKETETRRMTSSV